MSLELSGSPQPSAHGVADPDRQTDAPDPKRRRAAEALGPQELASRLSEHEGVLSGAVQRPWLERYLPAVERLLREGIESLGLGALDSTSWSRVPGVVEAGVLVIGLDGQLYDAIARRGVTDEQPLGSVLARVFVDTKTLVVAHAAPASGGDPDGWRAPLASFEATTDGLSVHLRLRVVDESCKATYLSLAFDSATTRDSFLTNF